MNDITASDEFKNLTTADFDQLGALLDQVYKPENAVPGKIRVGSYTRFKACMAQLGAVPCTDAPPITRLYGIDIVEDNRVPENKAILVSTNGVVMQVYNLDSKEISTAGPNNNVIY